MSRLLIVEDDEKIRASLLLQLREEGYAPQAMASAEEASAYLEDPTVALPELLLLDVRLRAMSGVDLVRRLAAAKRFPPTIIISGEASISETVEALRLGVHDFIEKPFSRERLLQAIRNTLEHQALKREVASLKADLRGESEILGSSPAIEEMRRKIARAAVTDARILIAGESGTGKELVASALHQQSARSAKAFIKINCAAIPHHLVEDELFGHAKGAFTDAKNAKPGLFEEADGGTLFLDEIGDMDLTVQSRLLRVLEDGRVRRVGETRDRQVDVRVLTATHRHLEEEVKAGRFREDLYFRLAHLPISVPALRERQRGHPAPLRPFPGPLLPPAPGAPAAGGPGAAPLHRALRLAGQRPRAAEPLRAAGRLRGRSAHPRPAPLLLLRARADARDRPPALAGHAADRPPEGFQGAVRARVHRERPPPHPLELHRRRQGARRAAHLSPPEGEGAGDPAAGGGRGGGDGGGGIGSAFNARPTPAQKLAYLFEHNRSPEVKAMRTSRSVLLVAALLLASVAPASAAWSPLGSPIQPFITLQLDPDRPELLYARVFASEGPTEDYLWRSQDGGATWRNVQSGLERPVSALAIGPTNPEVIWVWTADGQLWRSADAGDTWSHRYTRQRSDSPQVFQLLVDPHHPDTIYRIDYDGLSSGTRVAVSRDGGDPSAREPPCLTSRAWTASTFTRERRAAGLRQKGWRSARTAGGPGPCAAATAAPGSWADASRRRLPISCMDCPSIRPPV